MIKPVKQKSLTAQISRLVVFIVVGSFVFGGLVFIVFDWRQERAAIEADMTSAATLVASRSTAAFIYQDKKTMNQMLASLASSPQVEFACAYAADNTLLATYRTNANRACPAVPPDRALVYGDGSIIATAISIESDELAGTIYVNASLRFVNARIWRTVATLAAIMFVVSVIGLLLVRYQMRVLTRPLQQLTDVADKISQEGSYSMPSLPESSLEFATLWHAFERLMAEVKHKESVLVDREQNLRIMLDSIGDAVIATDVAGKVTRMNPVAEQLTGWRFADAYGKGLKTVMPLLDETSRLPIANPVDEVMATRRIVAIGNHTTLIAKDGREYQIADSAAPIIDARGVLIGVILVFHDVTEQYGMRRTMDEAQRRFRGLLESMPAVAYGKDAQGRYLFINREFERLFHLTSDSIKGTTDYDRFTKEFADQFRANDLAALQSEGPIYVEEIAPLDDGPHIYVSVKFRVRTDNNEYEMYGISTDVTQLRRAEQKLAGQQEEQRQILDNMVEAVISIDMEGNVRSFNRAAETMFGYQRADAIGMAFASLLAPISDGAERGEKITATGQYVGVSREQTCLRNSGDTFPARMSFASLQTADGGQRFVATCHDLTTEKLHEAQLQRTQKMDALGKLTGGIAHDINNLLGIILGYSELLQGMDASNAKLANGVNEIIRASERGKHLTGKLLAFSRRRSSNAMAVDINQMLRAERQMLERSLTVRVTAQWDLDESLWSIWVDAGELEDAIINLSINAKHAMPESGQLTFRTRNESLRDAEAEVLVVPAGDYVALSVIDTGIGMDEATQRRMFEPFFSTKGEQGTGLGLAQVYGFVSRSGGAIRVSSEVGQGSEITMYFPCHIRTQSELENLQIPGEQPLSGTETILVVDDESALRELSIETLSLQGYKVFGAGDAEQALKILNTEAVDLLLSDIILPGMDGHRLAQIVKERFPQIKIQLASGFSGERDANSMDLHLHEQRLEKPYRLSDLLRRVRFLLDS